MHRYRGVAVSLCAAVLATSCGAFGSGAADDGGNTVTVGLPTGVTSFANSDIVVADKQGYFADAGIDVEWKNLKSGVPVVQGVVGGALDVGAASIEPVVNAHSQGGGLKIIGSYADRLTVQMVTPKTIAETTDLRGKRLGVQEVGAFREVMTRSVLQDAGLTPDDAQYVPTDAQATMSALVQGKVQSAILQPEQSFAAIREDSRLHSLADLDQLLPDYYYGTFFVSKKWLGENRETAEKFITAITRAHRYMYEHKARTVSIVSKATEIDKAAVTKAYDDMLGKKGVFAVNEALEPDRINNTMDRMDEFGILEGKRPSVQNLVDRGPVTETVKELGAWKGDPRWR